MAVTERDDQPTLLGIAPGNAAVSCDDHKPVVMTRITSYLDWISRAANLKLRE